MGCLGKKIIWNYGSFRRECSKGKGLSLYLLHKYAPIAFPGGIPFAPVKFTGRAVRRAQPGGLSGEEGEASGKNGLRFSRAAISGPAVYRADSREHGGGEGVNRDAKNSRPGGPFGSASRDRLPTESDLRANVRRYFPPLKNIKFFVFFFFLGLRVMETDLTGER